MKRNSAVTLRYGRPDDLHQLADLERAAFPDDAFEIGLIEELLTQNRATVLVAEDQGRLVGVVYLLWKRHRLNKYCRVFSLAVDPSARSKGVGLGLMKTAEQEARFRSVARLTLEVRQTNLLAIQFYRKLGYRRTGKLRGFYPDGTDGLSFGKNLTLEDQTPGKFG
ncbi:MAG: GNAT family N-acetyltransferase [Nitrospinae bacterium]|nr:GNAT family N-acetyltransferase [Nitrospinota bacterium]MDA1108677.1 GNAT family N-acetyltransferase [Nitrospinota bacterium]